MMPNQSKFETEHDSDSDSNDDSYSSDCKPHNRNSSNEEDGEESSCDKWENETYPSAMTDYVRELVASRKECEQYSYYESLMPEQLSVPLTNTSFLTDYYEKVQEHHPSYLRSPSDLHYDNYPKVCEEPVHSDDNKYLISPNDPYGNLRSQVAYQSHLPTRQMMPNTSNMAGVGCEYTNDSFFTFERYIYIDNKTLVCFRGVSQPIYSQDIYSRSNNQPDYPQDIYSRSNNQPDYPQDIYSRSNNQPDYPQDIYSRSNNQPDYPQDIYSHSNNHPYYPQDMYSHSNNHPDYQQDIYSRSNNQPDYPQDIYSHSNNHPYYPQDMYSRSNNHPDYPQDMYSRSSNQPDYSKVHDAMAQDRVSSPTKSCLSDDLNSTPCQNTLSTDEDSCKDDSQSMKHEDCSIQDVGNKPMDIIDDKNNFVSISSPENKPDARIDTAFKVELGLLKANYMCSQDTNFVKMKPNNSSSKQDIFEGKKPNSPPPEVIFEGAILNVKRPTKTNNEQTYFEEENDQTLMESTSSPSPINNELLPLSEFVDIKTALTPIKIKNESCNSHKNMTTTDNSLLYDRDTKPDIKPMMCVDEKPRQRRKYVKKKCIETTEVSEYRKKLRSWVRREHCLSTGLPEKQSTVKQEHILTTKQETKFRSNIKLKREVIEQQGFQQQLNVKQEHILTTKQETKFRSNIKPKREVIEQQGLQQQSTVKQEHILTTKQETKFRSNIKLKREVIEQQGLQQQLNVKQEHILTTKQETKFRSNIKPKREVIEQQGLRRSARIKSALEKRKFLRAQLLTK